MTSEQMAEKYATEDLYDGYTKINYVKKRAYLDGLAEGRKECMEQIEKMKCCHNCEHSKFECLVAKHCIANNYNKWELAEY